MSPEILAALEKEEYEAEYNPYLSDCYSFGLVMLKASLLLKEKDIREINSMENQLEKS